MLTSRIGEDKLNDFVSTAELINKILATNGEDYND